MSWNITIHFNPCTGNPVLNSPVWWSRDPTGSGTLLHWAIQDNDIPGWLVTKKRSYTTEFIGDWQLGVFIHKAVLWDGIGVFHVFSMAQLVQLGSICCWGWLSAKPLLHLQDTTIHYSCGVFPSQFPIESYRIEFPNKQHSFESLLFVLSISLEFHRLSCRIFLTSDPHWSHVKDKALHGVVPIGRLLWWQVWSC